MAESVVSFVLQNITHLLTTHSDQLLNDQLISDHIQQVVAKFRWIQPFLKDADARLNEDRVRIWTADVRSLVYDAQDVIEGFLLKGSSVTKNEGSIWRYVCVLNGCLNPPKIVREMEAIHKRLDEITTRLRTYKITSTPESLSNSSLKRFYSQNIVEPQVVGLEDDIDKLVAYLVDESEDSYRVVSICGMGGLGKTTLAKKIYNHPSIKKRFDGLAWVSISQNLQLRNVLQRIIFCLVKDEQTREEIMRLEDVKLVEYLREIQSSRKCLVVVDNIWTNDDWDCLKDAFPTQCFKSKLMLTSRNLQLAHHVDPKPFLHQHQLLNEEQSWDLLRIKSQLQRLHYLSTKDMKEMEEFGREMVRHCRGLPLAIVVLGGMLVTKSSWEEWKNVHHEIQSSIKSGKGMGEAHQKEVVDILGLSYNDLPSQLKPCFLYLSRFREDDEIEAETLYQQWIAEGFVLSSDRKAEGETLMEVAESYLAELALKCMVVVNFEEKESSLRIFGSCKLHDLARDLALSKAKEDDFFSVVDLRQGNAANHHDDLPTYTRRLAIWLNSGDVTENNDIYSLKEASRQLRSMLWLNEGEWGLTPHPISRLKLVNFKLLRVFSFEGFDFTLESLERLNNMINNKMRSEILGSLDYAMNKMLSQVLGSLVHLRYLSLRNTAMIHFPSITENLLQLQTLDLRVSTDKLRSLPWANKDGMRKMGQLRHLYLPNFKLGEEASSDNKLRLEGLNKLETLENFDSDWCQVQDLHELNNLRKLKMKMNGENHLEETMQYLEGKASSRLKYVSVMAFWNRPYVPGNGTSPWRRLLGSDGFKLNELLIFGDVGELPAALDICNSAAASCLTHLVMSFSKLKEDPMPVLEKLPALRNLQLFKAFQGKDMVCSKMGFPQLKVLNLFELHDLEKWKVEQGSMPSLSEIGISGCNRLEELPEGLKFIDSLQSLRMVNMPDEFCDRVRGPDSYKVSHVPSLELENIESLKSLNVDV